MRQKLTESIQQSAPHSLSNELGDYFFTHDLGCATALLTAGFQLARVNKENPGRAAFVFKKAEGLEEAANNYFLCNLNVDARRYWDNARTLKNLLHTNQP